MKTNKQYLLSLSASFLAAAQTLPAVTFFGGTGSDSAALQPFVDNFRSALGGGATTPNRPDEINNSDGFRAIDWDAAPDAVSDPNNFPGDFFNTDFFPRARGMDFTTPGSGFALSSTIASGTATEFGSFNASYQSNFQTFSAERLFSPLGSNIVDVNFFNPANPTQAALVDGFGAVFVDVDFAMLSRIEYFDIDDELLATVFPEVAPQGLSFAGAHFDTEGEVVSRVRIYLGNGVLGDDDTPTQDIVVLDDFIAGEPAAIPEPSTALLSASTALLLLRRKRKAA